MKVVGLCSLATLGLMACGPKALQSGTSSAPNSGDHPAFTAKLRDPAGYRVNHHPGAQESLCGKNDLQQINAYDGSLGQPIDFARLHKFAVGAMAEGKAPTASKYCTGTLVAADLFITAGHCVDTTTPGQFVVFNYEKGTGGEASLPQDAYRIKEVVESGNDIDYSIIRVEGNPGLKWGWASLRTNQAAENEVITIIQHPSGEEKQIEVGHVLGFNGNYMTYGDLDTEPGSSGSGIVDAKGYLVGIHTNGGCTESGGSNSGVRLNAARSSQVLSRLANVKLPFEDGSILRLGLKDRGQGYSLNADITHGKVAVGQDEAATSWVVADNHDGSFHLKATEAGQVAYLDGRTANGAVALRATLDPADYGAKWRVVKTDDGQFALRTIGQVDGPRWLSGQTSTGAVTLSERVGGWEISVR